MFKTKRKPEEHAHADDRCGLSRIAAPVFSESICERRRCDSIADDPRLAPGINAIGVTYDFAHVPQHQAIMTARQATSGKIVNRMAHIDESSTDLLYKLEAVRLVCKVSGCAQRYLTHVEWPGGLSPPGSPRTVREPLDSYGSHCSAVSMA